MNDILNKLNMWSEVWSLIIPLTIILIFKPKTEIVKPVVIYVFVGLFLNLIATILYVYHKKMPDLLSNNNIFYNLHSFFRVLFFAWYFHLLKPTGKISFYKVIFFFYLILVLINFIAFESPLFFSSRLFTAEGLILLLFCLSFLLGSIQDESNVNWIKQPSFMIWTGLGLYEAITVLIFLFFYQLSKTDIAFGEQTMTIRKMTYTLFCILLAIALYFYSRRNTKDMKPVIGMPA